METFSAAFSARLETRHFGRVFEVHECLDSTMRRARELHAAGAPEGQLVVALSQSAGQGRRGRTFLSPHGGLYLTLLVAPPPEPAHAWRFGFATALATRRAVLALDGPKLLFDWPNDLCLAGRKVGGILLDLRLTLDVPPMVLIGLGLNLGPDPSEIDPVVAGSAGALRGLRGPESRAGVAAALLSELEDLLPRCGDTTSWQDVLQSVRASSLAGQGLPVTLRLADGRIVSGVGLGLGDDGSLLLRQDDGREFSVRYAERI